jgi:hypothetical protein
MNGEGSRRRWSEPILSYLYYYIFWGETEETTKILGINSVQAENQPYVCLNMKLESWSLSFVIETVIVCYVSLIDGNIEPKIQFHVSHPLPPRMTMLISL